MVKEIKIKPGEEVIVKAEAPTSEEDLKETREEPPVFGRLRNLIRSNSGLLPYLFGPVDRHLEADLREFDIGLIAMSGELETTGADVWEIAHHTLKSRMEDKEARDLSTTITDYYNTITAEPEE